MSVNRQLAVWAFHFIFFVILSIFTLSGVEEEADREKRMLFQSPPVFRAGLTQTQNESSIDD
jgi:hypothetical protein